MYPAIYHPGSYVPGHIPPGYVGRLYHPGYVGDYTTLGILPSRSSSLKSLYHRTGTRLRRGKRHWAQKGRKPWVGERFLIKVDKCVRVGVVGCAELLRLSGEKLAMIG